MSNLITRFQNYISTSQNIVFFGGAGVSTESGIPDFRSKDGLYNQRDVQFEKYDPEYLLSEDCLVREPKVFFEFYRQKMDTRHCEPNITHRALAKLEGMGKLAGVVTQNIDGLHQQAGSKNVVELHGTTKRCYCTRCRKVFAGDYIFDHAKQIPTCDACGGMVRPDVVLYGNLLPDAAVNKAVRMIANADMLIIGGTSLKVYPAAGFVRYFQGVHLVVINREDLSGILERKSDLMIQESLGTVFREI